MSKHRHVYGPVTWDGYAYCPCGRRIRDGRDLPPVTVRWHR